MSKNSEESAVFGDYEEDERIIKNEEGDSTGMEVDDEDEPEIVCEIYNMDQGWVKPKQKRRHVPPTDEFQGDQISSKPEQVTIDDEDDEILHLWEGKTQQQVPSNGYLPKYKGTVTLSDSSVEEEFDPIVLDEAKSEDDEEIQEIVEEQGEDDMIADEGEIEDVTPPEVIEASNRRQAEELKQAGNTYFVSREFLKALEKYTKAIELVPNEATFYTNRSACYLHLRRYKDSINDAEKSLLVHPNFEKGYFRLLRASIELGDVVRAEGVLQRIKESNIPLSKAILEEKQRLSSFKNLLSEIEQKKIKSDYRTILYYCDKGIMIAPGSIGLKICKVEALIHLQRGQEAQDICTDILHSDSKCVEAIYYRAICFYQSDNLDKAQQFIRHGLQLAPDNPQLLTLFRTIKRIKESREEATNNFTSGKYSLAKQKFTECLEHINSFTFTSGSIKSKMCLNLSLIGNKEGKVDEALKEVNTAIDLNPSYLKAILHRATLHKQKEQFDEAVRDYETAQRLDPKNTGYRSYIHETKLAAKKAKRKDYYKILGVDKNATEHDVKKAYKKRALLHHPDRHASASDEVKKEQEKQFKELGQAYEILSDPKKRSRYDAGHDLNDFGQESSGGDFDPTNLFNVFFGGGGGMPGGSGGMPGGVHFSFGGSRGRHHPSSSSGYSHYQSNFHPY